MEQKYYIARDDGRGYDLYHHGILGMKWGIRRYQNEDGSLTSAGKIRYAGDSVKFVGKEVGRAFKKGFKALTSKGREQIRKEKVKLKEEREKTAEQRHQEYKDYLKEHKQDFLSEAKEKDRWHIDFTEVFANDPMFDEDRDLTKSEKQYMLKQYAKFLDDPDK